ncbi:hypothetical protein VR7878_03965 [Vibrio ruber DSM 16370]|uniref:Uncharacterized protein n=1 Tax=Vibrio ruber (strain DSM 16370 / JCM 11486 / BCRC 17186 / CECT 7878 / LMG 23124 / VR1) TaxID=1123498 RepID=A0A1R4LTY6_VIBR1|nr:hypothetical protein [Vibrio ruber]SJN60061.1 hypothetical protein VR7878_03965 [Vibrio ruber DSM 16370]
MKDPQIINITCAPTPFVTQPKFAEMTGIPESSIEKMIKNSVLPTIPKDHVKGRVLIDMVETYRRIEAGQLVLVPLK